jgi:hypothetical protein
MRTKDHRDFSIPQVVNYFEGILNRKRRPAVNLHQFETIMKGITAA